MPVINFEKTDGDDVGKHSGNASEQNGHDEDEGDGEEAVGQVDAADDNDDDKGCGRGTEGDD